MAAEERLCESVDDLREGGGILRCRDLARKLESSIFNSVSLGEWEAARASFACLAANPASGENAKELLKILVVESANFWSESAAIPSPHHLSWLAIDAYKTLYPKEELPGYVQQLVELRLLLYSTRGLTSFSSNVASQLCQYHALHVLRIPGATPQSAPPFPSLTLSFLHDVITISSPALGHALIKCLTADEPEYQTNNEVLQSIYVDCIYEYLEALNHLKSAESLEADSSYDSQYESDHAPTGGMRGLYRECQRLVASVYDLLSLMDPKLEMTKLSEKINRLFLTLLKVRYVVTPEYTAAFESSRLYSCLLGRSTPFLINRFHKVEEYIRTNRTTEGGRTTETEGNPLEEWRELFYEALYDNKHWLERVLDNGLQLVYTAKLEELGQLLSCPEHFPLRPVLLLLGWDKYPAVGSGRELLETLWPAELSMRQPLLFQGCCRLAFQVELVQWCLEKARPHLHPSPSPAPTTAVHRAENMFKGLETHSVLYVLHHFTPLASLDPIEVIEILKLRPRTPSLTAPFTPPPQFSRGTTPMKLPSEVDTSPSPSPLSTPLKSKSFSVFKDSTLRPEQERDISIFRSFCAMKLVLDAVWASLQIASGLYPMPAASETQQNEPSPPDAQPLKATPPTSRAVRKLDLGLDEAAPKEDTDALVTGTLQEAEKLLSEAADRSSLQEQLYKQQVLEKLQEAKVYLSLVYPLNYRLEVLENIFSLLFLTSEDIKQIKIGDLEATAASGRKNSSSVEDAVSSGVKLSHTRSNSEVSAAISSIALIKHKHGFLVNEKIASDLLDSLQDCIFELRAARFVLSQSADSHTGPPLSPNAVKSCINNTALQQRSTKLEQYINEARWRIQLVSAKHGITAGISERNEDWLGLSSSGESGSEWSESEGEAPCRKEGESRRKPRKTPADSQEQKPEMPDTPAIQEPKSEPLQQQTQQGQRSPTFGTKPPSMMAPSKATLSGKRSPIPNTPSPSLRPSSPGAALQRSATLPPSGTRSPKLPRRHQSLREKGGLRIVESSIPGYLKISTDSAGDADVDADVDDRSPDQSKRRKKFRPRGVQKRKRGLSDSSRVFKSSIVCRMLASPSSLLRMCLKHSNYHRASEVLKMFGMEGQFGEAFVRFSEQYELVSRELAQHSRSSTPRGSPSLTPSLTPRDEAAMHKSLTMSASSSGSLTTSGISGSGLKSLSPASASGPHMHLQVAIMNAANSSFALESLHRLLAPSSINRMLFSGDEHLEKVAQESVSLRMLVEHVPTLVMLDLVCSTKVDGQIAKRIIELAAGRCRPALETMHLHAALAPRKPSTNRKWSQPHQLSLGGPFSLLLTLSDVSGYFTCAGMTPPTHGASPHSLFSSFSHHFKANVIMNMRMFGNSYSESREGVEGLLAREGAAKDDVITLIASAEEQEAQRPSHAVGSVFDELVRALKSTPHSPVLASSAKERSLMKQPSSGSLAVALEEGEGLGVGYVWQFSRYLSKLVEILCKCLGTGSSIPPEGSLLLSVLQESPTHILGRLVFERGIKPQWLALLTSELPQLQIVEVIVKCCCPLVPGPAAIPDRATLCPQAPIVVALNEGEPPSSAQVADPCAFSQKLLSKLLATLRDFLPLTQSQDGMLGLEELKAAYTNPEMKELLAKTVALASVDLSTLDTPSRQMAFYSNIANFLYAHAIMAYLAGDLEGEGPGRLSMLLGAGVSMATMQSSRIVQAAYFSKVGYYIGQLGLVSCFDLHHSVLRRGLHPPVLSLDNSLKPRITPVRPDPWAEHAPSSPDPRLLYVVHNGMLSSPLPVPLSPDDLSSSLRAAETQYLNATVSIDLGKKEVMVPQWLFDHHDNLVKPVWSEAAPDTSFSYLSDLALLKYIHSKLPREKAELLAPVLEVSEPVKAGRGKKLPLNIVVKKDNLSFGYNFNLKRSSVSPKTSPKLKKKKRSKEEKKREAVLSPAGNEAPVSYAFTPETLAFVKQQSSLMAALVHLLCPPPTGRTGKTAADEKEEEGEGAKDEGEGGTGGRMQVLQSFRRKTLPPPQKESLSLDELTPAPQMWKKQLEEVLSHFSTSGPMRQFLITRLCCFEAILPWDTPKSATPPKKSRRSSPEHTISLRRLAALPTSSREVGDACSFVLRKLLELGKVSDAVRFLASEPATCHLSKVAFLTDITISSAFVRNYSEILALGQSGEAAREKTAISNPVALVSQLSNPEQAARLSLASLKNWPVEVCVDLLSYCFHHLPLTSPLLPIVTGRLERMRGYTQIMKVCENPLPPASGQVWRAAQSPWNSWSELAGDSESRPDYVLRVLLASREFELARNWSKVHSLGQDITQQIEVDYLFVLLEGDSPDPIAAQQVLDSLSDDRLTLQVCEAVLSQCEDLQTTIFILHYMLTRLLHCIHIARTHSYCNRLLGAKALLCLPGSVRHVYESLVPEPILLVEQLLLDMKIDWASNVIKQLRQDEHLANISTSDTPTLDHTPMIIPEEEEARDPFTPLMMFYAAKALEFPQPVLTRSTPQLPSMLPSAATTCPPSPTPFPPTPHHAAPPRPVLGERQLSTESATPRVSFSYKRRISLTLASPPSDESPYEPPPSPPPREEWEPDGTVMKCRVCRQVYFGMFSRRHHCRRCGRVVCAGCSSRVVPVDGYERPVRVCDDCFHHMSKSASTSEDSHLPSMDLGSVYPGLATSPLHHWKLIPKDPLFNDSLRKEFFYERTPNTALCLALVDLMSHVHMSAAYLLDCCHSVSAQLVPDPQGRVNEEVDHYFVIGLIQHLLMNAKLRFAGAGDSSGVELCDTYLSRVDLLRQLVSSRWSCIPSIQELTKPDLARRVRDRLIEDDRFGLAMEVSTKCQLDTGGVWAAWGMACLNSGDFTGARSKFRYCFQVSSQSKMGSGAQNLPLLNRIVEQIEQNPLAITGRHTQYSEEWSSVIVGSMALSEKRTEDCDLDIHRFNECVFYIRGYGPPSSLVSFFVRHNCWTDACKYILDHHCNTDVFVEHLWVPALKAGMIEMVQECMRDMDPSLSAWEIYLTATCRYFTQRSLYSVLYNTQLFMKDYIRAGMTCIKFFIGFSGRSTTAADLFSRLHYLHTARRHFQMALEEKQRSLERRGGRARGQQRHFEDPQRGATSVNKSMNMSELHNHISTISLQMKVIKFLYQCAEAMGTLGDPVPMAVGSGGESPSSGRHTIQQPATLFSNGHVRAEVAAQLLIGSHDIIEGFELTKEILQAYRLPPVSIFCGASRGLAKKQRYGDIRLLLQCIQKSRFGSDSLNDEIIMAAIKVLANQTRESKQVEKLVQLLTSERSKIKALVSCGKLKSAYLIAVKSKLVDEVRNISEIAGKAGQLPVRDICEKWLQANTV